MDELEVIRGLPESTMERQVKGFIRVKGLIGGSYQPSRVLREPLLRWLGNMGRFKWTEDCQQSFDCLKQQIDSHTPTDWLRFEQTNGPIHWCEWPLRGCGYYPTLSRKGRTSTWHTGRNTNIFPVPPTHKTQWRWPVIEKEVFAIMYILKKLDYYLSGAVFTIKTDLQALLERERTNKKINQWALKLSDYDCTIECLAGKDNTCADLFSRLPKKKLEAGVDNKAW